MSLVDNIKNFPDNLAEVMRKVSEAGKSGMTVKKAVGATLKITIKTGADAEDLDLEGMDLAELENLLAKLEQQLSIVEADEPEDVDSDEYEEWEEMIDELEEQMDQVQSAIDDYEE